MSQANLARKAAVSVSLLSKIEVGDRALTPAVAAAIGKALGVSMAEVLGRAPVALNDEERLSALRSAMRDFDLPSARSVAEGRLSAGLDAAGRYRDAVDVTRLIALLPGLLRDATAHAHAANTVDSWTALADVYSTVYWLAARHRWMDMAELAVTRQRWAVEQKPNPLGEDLDAHGLTFGPRNTFTHETGHTRGPRHAPKTRTPGCECMAVPRRTPHTVLMPPPSTT
ncbi:helix-turn-helix domain-containing protein [Streptomyces sp. NPDC050485]|uniref:helix-turn-helix domain-containing protein n=1 Tax=Streptomyces sp. NPDC050485 TaxID=3365617 RepID=UPI0037990E84